MPGGAKQPERPSPHAAAVRHLPPADIAIVAGEMELARVLAADVRAATGSTPAILHFEDADELLVRDCDLILVVADAEGTQWRALARDASAIRRIALASAEPTLDDATDALRLGLVDLLRLDVSRGEIAAHIRRLVQAAHDAARPAPLELVATPNDHDADEIDLATTRAEFRVLAQLELDVESLLRTTLEYVLHKIGPTNATIFLPTGGEDFTLGAYVNYDCPRDSVDMLLDHMASMVAPAVERHPELRRHRGDDAMDRLLGPHAAWLTGCEAVTFACEHEDELLASVALFRDDRDPFDGRTMARLAEISSILAAQLARIVRVHHRHLPADPWDASEDQSDEPGLAA
ncbi:MAG: hypothetical protein AAFX79_01800 [Planctomycetota bacterium]